MAHETTTVQAEQEEEIINEVTGNCSATYDFSIYENGTLDIMDNESRYRGDEENPKEFIRLDIASMRVLYSLLSEPKVQALLASA
jgi:hypothetical protein